MKIASVILIILLVIAGGAFTFLRFTSNDEDENQYKFAEIAKGDLKNIVTSTGTIEAVSTVEVGTQVSGTIASMLADFNDQVIEGQLLAVLDTTVLNTAIIEAEASVEQITAQVDEAKSKYERNLPLFKNGFLSEDEFHPIKTALITQQAAAKSTQAKLERARQNYEYAFVRSPITGTIIQRNVEAGQTVAASLSAPVLFVIAEDLSQMEIKALVDESDIGQIEEGQGTRFTVLAYPDETFEGIVRQVRLQPSTVQNVVNYTVLIDANNMENLLLPGMTATVEFIVDHRENIMMIQTAALQFQPSVEMMKNHQKRPEHGGLGRPDFDNSENGDRRRPERPPMIEMQTEAARTQEADENTSRLWYLKADGSLAFITVTTGMSADNQTEISSDGNIAEGTSFICGSVKTTSVKKESSSAQSGPPGRGLGRI